MACAQVAILVSNSLSPPVTTMASSLTAMQRRHLQLLRVATSWGRRMNSPLISALGAAGSSAREAILILVSGGRPWSLGIFHFLPRRAPKLLRVGLLRESLGGPILWHELKGWDEKKWGLSCLFHLKSVSFIHYWDGRWLAIWAPSGWEGWSETLMSILSVSLYLYRLQPGRLWPCPCKE